MTDQPAPDQPVDPQHEPAPTVERTSVLAVGELDALDVRRALVRLAALRGPTLAPLVRTSPVDGGVALTHRVPAAAVSLGSLRAHGPMRAGHVLGVGVAVLEALTLLHDAGLAHGRVDADSVLVGPDGGVVLSGTGAGWRLAPGQLDGPAPADDVAAVGELLRDLLGPGSAPAALVVTLVRAVDPDLALRPRAGALLEALRRCGRRDSLLDLLWAPRRGVSSPAPERNRSAYRDDDPPPPADETDADGGEARASRSTPPAPPRAGTLRHAHPAVARAGRVRRGPRRRDTGGRRPRVASRLLAALVLGGLAVAVAVSALGRSPVRPPTAAAAATQPVPSPSGAVAEPGEPSTSAPPTSAPLNPDRDAPQPAARIDWRAVLDEVDRGRAAALAAGSEQRLATWVTGTAYVADLALVRAIAASGARLEGGGLVLEEVRPVEVGPTSVVLQVRDRRSAYAVVADGSRQSVPERPARTWAVTLVRASPSAQWRIAEVGDAAISPGGRR